VTGANRKQKRTSLRTAIDAKCRECIYDPYGCAGTWRQQVAACTSPQCPLFPVRPMPQCGTVKDDPVKAAFSTNKRRSPYSLYTPTGPVNARPKREDFGA
jgi:hypothetical protein